MYCKECGKIIDDDSKFCSFCGMRQSIKHVIENQPEQIPKPDTVTQNVNISLSFKKPTFKKAEDRSEISKVEKYDRTYEGDSHASLVGIIILIVNSSILAITTNSYYPGLSVINTILIVVWWIISIFWVVNIAKRQNRDTIGWGVFAFFLPYLALIIIGFLKKLNKQSLTQNNIESSQTIDSKASIVNECDEMNSDIQLENLIFDEIDKETYNDFWGRKIRKIEIKFSDGKFGEIFCSKEKYFIKDKGWRTFYINKEATIKALYYLLATKKQLSEGFLYTD